ncbi:MAG TPA: Uma2 family endonuclease [Verrucomicrobiota bacterium]|nr:Uma2 family endonuclease [Verrucomicrobiota bacterium]
MTGLLEQVMELPTLPEFVAELDTRLAAERERRRQFYEQIPDGAKWEFINGEVIMHSPDMVRHMAVRRNLESLLWNYVNSRQLGTVLAEKGLCVFPRNDFMPDVIFFGRDKAATLQAKQLRLPVPDFACEVLSDSTARRDRGVKFRDFEAHGVVEYWLVDADAETVEQFLLRDGAYVLELKSGSGQIRSHAVVGFEIPIRALFDPAENLAALRSLLGDSGPPV